MDAIALLSPPVFCNIVTWVTNTLNFILNLPMKERSLCVCWRACFLNISIYNYVTGGEDVDSCEMWITTLYWEFFNYFQLIFNWFSVVTKTFSKRPKMPSTPLLVASPDDDDWDGDVTLAHTKMGTFILFAHDRIDYEASAGGEEGESSLRALVVLCRRWRFLQFSVHPSKSKPDVRAYRGRWGWWRVVFTLLLVLIVQILTCFWEQLVNLARLHRAAQRNFKDPAESEEYPVLELIMNP